MITKYTFQDQEKKIEVQIIHSARKSLSLEIKPTGKIIARVPNRLPDKETEVFIENHRQWILKKLHAPKNIQPYPFPPMETITDDEASKIKTLFLQKVEHYAKIMGVSYGRIAIRNQKTLWGSCSSRGNINFNYRLAYLPEELLDYVVIHELAHRIHMNHSGEFWQEVATYCPDYKNCRKRLREIPLS